MEGGPEAMKLCAPMGGGGSREVTCACRGVGELHVPVILLL